jgi:hypothetical protein
MAVWHLLPTLAQLPSRKEMTLMFETQTTKTLVISAALPQ